MVDGIANVIKIKPEELRSVLGYLMLLDVVGQDEFRYALYGSRIAQDSGFDLTGKTIWQIPASRGIQLFVTASYLAAMKLRRPIYTVHQRSPSITVDDWHRLILPLGLEGVIKRFLVCNVPVLDGEIR